MPSFEQEFSSLAARMSAGLDDVRACLVVTRDGLTLGVHPPDGEARAREAWDRLQTVGDPQRGFLDLGMEIVVVARRGPYGAIMVAGPDARPGLLLDRMDALLLAAEQARARAGEAEADAGRTDAVRRPRAPLHRDKPEPERQEPRPGPRAPAAAAPEGRVVKLPETADQPATETARDALPRTGPDRAPLARSGPGPGSTGSRPDRDRPGEEEPEAGGEKRKDRGDIDRIALAREFGRLLSDTDRPGAL